MAIGVKVPIISELNSKGFKSALAEFKKLEGATAKAGFLMKKAFSPAGLTAMAGAIGGIGVAMFKAAEAAAEDQKSQALLAQQIRNVTDATDEQIGAIEDAITAMQLASGVSDTDLRKSFAILTRATRDTSDAYRLLALAQDISAGSGKSLDTVSTALGKAQLGQVSALKKLGVPLSENTVKTNNFAAATKELTATFGGAAQTNASTYSGQLAIMRQKLSEAWETIGYRLIPVLQQVADWFLKATEGAETLGGMISGVLKNAIRELTHNADGTVSGFGRFLNAAVHVANGVIRLKNGVFEFATSLVGADYQADKTIDTLSALAPTVQGLSGDFRQLGGAVAITQEYLNNFQGPVASRDLSEFLQFQRDWEMAMVGIGNASSGAADVVDDSFARFARAVQEAQKALAGMVTGYLDLNAAAEAGSVGGFVQSVTGQAAQIKNLAKNLGTLSARGLAPQAIQGIMSLDLGTAASLAQDLVNSAFSTRYIRQLNTAYQGIASTATSFGQSFGGNFMTGGAVSIGQVTVVSNDPRKFVSGLRQYARANGSVPIPVTGSL
jgi:hypothetical protein